MKNKEFYKLLKKNQSNSNAGFTLTELLVGLFVSIFVVGALGFGLMQLLRTTRVETSKVEVRGETSRALDFISDEVRRARTIETDATNAGTDFSSITNETVVLALDIPEISDAATAGVTGRVVYYLKSTNLGNWQGPQVLYRWGPPLDANGDYTAGAWQEEALIDGIDDTNIAADPCLGDTLAPALGTASGFHACINGGNNTAQLYLTGETKIAGGTDTYTANTKVVARARTASPGTTSTFTSYTMSYKSLGAVYNCHPSYDSKWSMRSVFDIGGDEKSWIHQDGRQPQPIQIDTSTNNSLKVTTIPVKPVNSAGVPLTGTPGVDDYNCMSRGSEAADGTEALADYADASLFPNFSSVPFTMNFTGPNYWKSFNGNEPGDNDPSDDPIWVTDDNGNETILMLKEGSIIPGNVTGYDFNNDTVEDQDSLGKFLATAPNNYAVPVNPSDLSQGYRVTGLEPDERIMAVEVGHNASGVPGFDVQDSVIILASDLFAQDHSN